MRQNKKICCWYISLLQTILEVSTAGCNFRKLDALFCLVKCLLSNLTSQYVTMYSVDRKEAKKKTEHIFHTRCYKIPLTWCILHASDSFKVRENQHGTQHVAVLMLQRSKCKENWFFTCSQTFRVAIWGKMAFQTHKNPMRVCLCVLFIHGWCTVWATSPQ